KNDPFLRLGPLNDFEQCIFGVFGRMNAIAIGAFDQQIIRGGYDGGIGNDRLIRAAEIAAEQNFLSRRQPKLDEPRSEDMARRKKASRTAGGKLEQIAELLR